MAVQKVADYVIDYIASKGIDKVFVVYGAANGDLIDAFTRTTKTEYVAMMHEQAAGFAMEGYAKTSGKFGVGIATSGPGGQNFVTPMGNFFYDSVPGLFITGQINSRFLRPDDSIRQIGFQETDIVSICKPVTKYAVMVKKAEDIRYELEKALHLMSEGRPGPVLLDIPLDIQKQEVDTDKLVGYSVIPVSHSGVDEFCDKFILDLKKSKRPCMIVGGGCKNKDLLKRVAEVLQIPIFPTWNALDIVTSDFPFYGGRIGTYGGEGRNFGVQNSDLMLLVGSRLSGRITGGNVESFGRGAKKYVVDVDPANLQPKLQQVRFDENLCADSEDFLLKLWTKLYNLPYWPDWVSQVEDWRKKYNPVSDKDLNTETVHPYLFGKKLSEHMSPDAVLVGDCGGNIVVLNHSFDTKYGQKYFTNNGNSPMGFSFAGAIGAYLAKPGEVVCVIGDGGFNMNLQELQTLINYNVKVKTFIMNNHIYGITKAFQETNFQGRAEACGPKGYNPPDFVKISDAYGVKTFTVDKNEDLDSVIRQVLDYDGPCVCDVNCHEYHTYEPRIFGWKTPIEDMYPYLEKEEFNSNMIIEPLGNEREYPR